jgi:hypothetical protein
VVAARKSVLDEVNDVERAAIQSEPLADEGWPEAWPFDRLDTPPFPVEVLSPWMREWSSAQAEAMQTPVDLPACIALATASLCVARMFHVEVRAGWTEPTNLWIVVAMNPGERKSNAFMRATEPVYAWVRAETQAKSSAIAMRAFERRVLEGQLKEAERAAVAGKLIGGVTGVDAARDLRDRLEKLPELHPPVLLTDDCTPEALAVLLSQYGERMGIFSAEGGPLEMMAGRYSDKGSNFEIHLKAHPGDPHIVHRISRESIALTHPLLTMALTVQPSVIAGLATREGFRGRGLLARFLYSLPQTALGRRKVNPAVVSEPVQTAYRAAVATMLVAHREQRTLTLTTEADEARAAWQAELEPRLGLDGDMHVIGDWANKLVGATARIAGVMHVSDWAPLPADLPSEVPVETWRRAEVLSRYLLEHARAAFGHMGADEATELAKRILAWCRRGRRRSFTQREAQRATTTTLDVLAPALATLLERGLVRVAEPEPAESTGGRPSSPTYDVRPSVLT